MAFTQNTFATVGAQAAPSPTIYSYSSTDNLADVVIVGYFVDKSQQLEEGDFIIAFLGDGHAFLEVLTDTSTVKVVDVAISGEQSIKEITTTYQQLLDDDILFTSGTFTITLVDAATAFKPINIRNITGAVTITASVGTTETTLLTVGQSSTLAPRSSGWFAI